MEIFACSRAYLRVWVSFNAVILEENNFVHVSNYSVIMLLK